MEPDSDELLRAAYQFTDFSLPFAEYRARVYGIAQLYATGRVAGASDRRQIALPLEVAPGRSD